MLMISPEYFCRKSSDSFLINPARTTRCTLFLLRRARSFCSNVFLSSRSIYRTPNFSARCVIGASARVMIRNLASISTLHFCRCVMIASKFEPLLLPEVRNAILKDLCIIILTAINCRIPKLGLRNENMSRGFVNENTITFVFFACQGVVQRRLVCFVVHLLPAIKTRRHE